MEMESEPASRSLEEAAQRRRSTGDMRMHRAARIRPRTRLSVDLPRDSGIALGSSFLMASPSGANTAQGLPAAPAVPGPPPEAPTIVHLPTLNERRGQAPSGRRPRRVRTGRFWKVLGFFGYGNGDRYRRELVSMMTTLSFGFVQFCVTLAFIIYTAIHHSPTDPSISEWKACNKPLGAWAVVWIVKLFYDCGITYWGWTRDWKGRKNENRSRTEDTERAVTRPNTTTPNQDDSTIWRELEALATATDEEDENLRRIRRSLPYSKLYSRLSLLLSVLVIAWFLTSNILLYTSVHTCRFAAPHLWWLIFGILCIQYFIIAQVILIALIVFIIGPLIYLFWNIVLMCFGRHPLQNPHYINPDIGKLSKGVVDSIPLVMYIPSPPEGEKGAKSDGVVTKPEPIYIPGSSEHIYPPKPPQPKRMFTFMSRKSSGLAGKQSVNGKKDGGGAPTWEDCWESNDLPFVRLDENRASCAICLLDFEEPKRRVASEVIKSWAQPKQPDVQTSDALKDPVKPLATGNDDAKEPVGNADTPSSDNSGEGGASNGSAAAVATTVGTVQEGPASQPEGENGHTLRLEDAGEGAQPLRLLECGHVFHKTCIDPWLTDVSGRCPTCQRPVTVLRAQLKRNR